MYAPLDYLGTHLPASDDRYKHNPAQLAYAESVEDALNQGVNRLHCIEGDTGIGKTLAYLLPLADWVARSQASRRRVILSTFSRALQRQLVSAENQRLVNDYLAREGLAPLRFAVRMGRANYVSPPRLALMLEADSLDAVVADKKRDRRERNLAEWALTSEGCLLELEESDLPEDIELTDIALTQGEPLPDALAEHFADAKRADVLVINHALLVQDLIGHGTITNSNESEVALLLDEAEHFPDVAAQTLSHRLSFANVARLARRMRFRAAADRWQTLFDATVSPRMANEAADVSAGRRDELIAALSSIKRTPHNRDPETLDAQEWLHIRETAITLLDRLKRGDTEVVVGHSSVRGLPSLVYADADAGRCLRIGMDSRITLMTSATLSDMSGDSWRASFRYLLSRLALNQADRRVGVLRRHSAVNFGRLHFKVPTDMPPVPLQADADGFALNDEYARRAVKHSLDGATGRVLVLCASYADVEALSRAWPDRHRGRLVTHPPGAAVNVIAQSLGSQSVLVTPAGWEGLSPERADQSFWSRVVILRNPTGALNPADHLLLANNLRRRGYDKALAQSKAKNILYAQNDTKTLHRLRQGIGRAIRHPDDEAEIVFLDPRFKRSGESVSTNSARGLAAAIPKRFRHAYVRARQADVPWPGLVL